jgi:hypothetical protein
MDRRAFVVGSGAALLAAPLAAEAQQAGKVWRIGILSPSTMPSETARRQSPLMQKLAELGYVENQNLVVEYRAAEGKIDRLPGLWPSGQSTRFRLGLLQPKLHVHLAVHRHRGGEMFPCPLPASGAPAQCAETEMATGDERSHPQLAPER